MKKLFLVLTISLMSSICYADSSMVFRAAGTLTGLSDIGSGTVTAGRLLVADGTKFQSVDFTGTAKDLSAAGAFTGAFDEQYFFAAPSVTTRSFRTTDTRTVNRVLCYTDTGTVTLSFRQCITTPTTGCNEITSSDITCTTSGASGALTSAASSITGGNYYQFNFEGVSGSPNILGTTVNFTQ